MHAFTLEEWRLLVLYICTCFVKDGNLFIFVLFTLICVCLFVFSKNNKQIEPQKLYKIFFFLNLGKVSYISIINEFDKLKIEEKALQSRLLLPLIPKKILIPCISYPPLFPTPIPLIKFLKVTSMNSTNNYKSN